MYLRKRAQTILEYSILIAIIIAALVVMQSMMKRGYQGRLKDSSDRMAGGDSFSLSDSTILEDRLMLTNRTVHEETATSAVVDNRNVISNFDNPVSIIGTTDRVYTASVSNGGDMQTQTMSKMSRTADEGYLPSEYVASSNELNPMSNDVTQVFR